MPQGYMTPCKKCILRATISTGAPHPGHDAPNSLALLLTWTYTRKGTLQESTVGVSREVLEPRRCCVVPWRFTMQHIRHRSWTKKTLSVSVEKLWALTMSERKENDQRAHLVWLAIVAPR